MKEINVAEWRPRRAARAAPGSSEAARVAWCFRAEVASSFEAISPKHELAVDVPESEVWVRCDPLRIDQVLSNLINNAIKFSPAGGRVTVQLKRDGHEAILSVADCGIGISDEDQQRLFEPFRRVGPSRDTIPGVGLGLFVVRQIVLAHGGRVELASAPGRGTEFRVRLQAVASPHLADVDPTARRGERQEPLAH
jgi:two-component system, OmpR family, sensor histidine kinase MtrB